MKMTDITSKPYKGTGGFSEANKGRLAYRYGKKIIQFEVIILRRTSDGKLCYYSLVPYVLK